MKRVVIVVPIYKVNLSWAENISLLQLYRILGDYPICYVAPKKLKENFEGKALWIEYFEDKYFKDVPAYSEFCLSACFYERFKDYEYMLLYQTDAFVFKNNLEEFCNMDYDYIGGPWPWFWAKYDNGFTKCRVGNGGLSLRKISSALRIVEHRDNIIATYHDVKRLLRGEDLFWAYVSTLPNENFSIPKASVARKFAVTGQSEQEMKHLDMINLPFGCHAWYKPEVYTRWRKWIVAMGYENLPMPPKKKPSETLRYQRIRYAHRYLKFRLNRQIKTIKEEKNHFNLNVWSNLYRGGYMLLKYKVVIHLAKMHLIHFDS